MWFTIQILHGWMYTSVSSVHPTFVNFFIEERIQKKMKDIYVFISQPMRDVTYERYLDEYDTAVKEANYILSEMVKYKEGNAYKYKFHFSSTYKDYDVDAGGIPVPSNVVTEGLYMQSNALKKMSFCHHIYFAKGWEKARGCVQEYIVAYLYDMDILNRDYTLENAIFNLPSATLESIPPINDDGDFFNRRSIHDHNPTRNNIFDIPTGDMPW